MATREEIEEMEAICKREWRYLAETGDRYKSEDLYLFLTACPACHIAAKAANISEEYTKRCIYCPIDRWRASLSNLEDEYKAACMGDNEPYRVWYEACKNIEEVEERKEAAAIICELEWSYLDVYEQIDLTEVLKDE